jgi:polyphosphate glucokinase
MVTFGTGIGTAIFIDGRLLPNTELGHLEIRGREAEARAAAIVKTRRGWGWIRWARAVDEYLQTLERLFSPDRFIIGGGISRESARFLPRLTVMSELIPAAMGNDAGIVGAAIAAEERLG